MRYGTKEELEAAKDDATLLPFDVVFKSLGGDATKKEVFRMESIHDDLDCVMFVTKEYTSDQDWFEFDFMSADQLEAINV